MNAYEHWLFRESKGSPETLAIILVNDITGVAGNIESPVWDWLKETGHKNYSMQTFQLVAVKKLDEWSKYSKQQEQ